MPKYRGKKHIETADTWLICNVEGWPTPGEPSVTPGALAEPDKVSRCYELWKSRGAECRMGRADRKS